MYDEAKELFDRINDEDQVLVISYLKDLSASQGQAPAVPQE